MAVWFRASLVVLAVLLLPGCGGEDAAKPGQSYSSNVSVPDRDQGAGGEEPPVSPPVVEPPVTEPPVIEPPIIEPPVVEPPVTEPPVTEPPVVEPPEVVPPEPEPPLQTDLDSNVFFPTVPGMQLFFDNALMPVVLGEGQRLGRDLAYPLQYADILSHSFTSTPAAVGLRAMRVMLLDNEQPVYLDVVFNSSRPVLGNAARFNTVGFASVRLSGLPLVVPLRLRVESRLIGNEWVSLTGMADQPARRIEVTQRIGIPGWQQQILLQVYPWLRPLFSPLRYQLWLSPGVGVVRVEAFGKTLQVNRVAGVEEPLVFAVRRNGNASSWQPLPLVGESLIDNSWQPVIHYRTQERNWLDVVFDGTGSWQARISRTNLPVSVQAATVRFVRGGEIRDVTVSLMVE